MITVVVPAYNAAKTLPACLKALQGQTKPPNEIIVVDDGSQDDTIRVAREHGARVLTPPHQGPAAARNLGIHEAHGDIILFTDADCEPVPDWVAEMVQPFTDPDIAGVKGSYLTRQNERVARLVQCEFEERYDLQEKLKSIDVVDSYAAAFRHEVLNETGGFDPAFPRADNEDVELSYRLEHAGFRMVFNRQAVVYHWHPRTWRGYISRKIKRGYWRMMVYRLYPGKVFVDSYTPQMLKMQIALMYLVLGLSGLGFVYPMLAWGAAAAFVGLCSSAFPFVRRAMRRDATLALSAFVFILVRALAFSIGIVGGLAGMIFFQPKLFRKTMES